MVTMIMTFDNFILLLETTPRNWQLSEGCIRSDCGCPLEVVAKHHYGWLGSDDWIEANHFLGFSSIQAATIITAADRTVNLNPSQMYLRQQMLKACGLDDFLS